MTELKKQLLNEFHDSYKEGRKDGLTTIIDGAEKLLIDIPNLSARDLIDTMKKLEVLKGVYHD